MATHALGTGTVNLSINVPRDERALLGRLGFAAVQRGECRSVGDWLRALILAGVEAKSPAAALRLREIRTRYYAGALTVLICAATVLTWVQGDDEDAMCRPRGQRVVKVTPVRGGRSRFEVEV